jgi:hypothetical protein
VKRGGMPKDQVSSRSLRLNRGHPAGLLATSVRPFPHHVKLMQLDDQELLETAQAIRRILNSVERRQLDAPPGLAARLDGAARALEVLANQTESAESTPGT